MGMHNLIEYSDNYSKICGSLDQCQRDEPCLDNNGGIAHFTANNNNSVSFKFKTKIADTTKNNATKNVKIRVPLKY